ncbi:MAG: CSLREA domain-containing protein [Myxococcales bacterium]|nr:CSLREA domain-containing protein [Myxococcales bacterium]
MACVTIRLCGALSAGSVSAATITVDTLVDTDIVGDGICTLREAIIAADSDSAYHECPAGSGTDTIEFSVTGTAFVNSVLPDITESLIIKGPGFTKLILDGSSLYQLLSFPGSGAGESLNIRGVKFRNGSGFTGGAITTGGNTTLITNEVRFRNCSSSYGGALYMNTNS